MKTTPNNTFSKEDLDFLSKFTGLSLEELKNKSKEIKEESKESSDWDYLNKISNNRGSETYHALMNNRIQSLEYTTGFGYLKNRKVFDLNTKEGMKNHVYRNKNQYGKAPKDLETMLKFVSAGYFTNEGFSPCHNIVPELNNIESRYKTLSEMVLLYRTGKLAKPNIYSPMFNISFRGRQGTSFEGCQFVYNFKTNQLVTDNVNRGTWDYGKYGTPMHYFLDILPWLDVGNGDNAETPDMFIMTPAQEKQYLNVILDDTKLVKDEEFKPNYAKTVLDLAKAFFTKRKDEEKLVVSGEEFVEKYIKNIDKSREDFIDSYINDYLGHDKIISCCERDFDALAYFINIVTRLKEDFYEANGVSSIETKEYGTNYPVDPKVLLSDANKEKLAQTILTKGIKEHLIKDFEYEYDLPIYISVEFSEKTQKEIESVRNNEEYCNSLINFRMNEILGKIHETIDNKYNKQVDDFYPILFVEQTASHKGFCIKVMVSHRVSQAEAVYCGRPAIDQFVRNYNAKPVLVDNSTGLTDVNPREYSGESVLAATMGITGVLLGIAGISWAVYNTCKDQRTLGIIKKHVSDISKDLEAEYTRVKGWYKKFKSSNFLKDCTKYDKHGIYDWLTKDSEYYNTSIDSLTKEMFIEELLLNLARSVNDAKGSGQTLKSLIEDDFHMKYDFLSARPLFGVIQDVKARGGEVNDGTVFSKPILDHITRTFANYSNQKEGIVLIPEYSIFNDFITLNGKIDIHYKLDSDKIEQFIQDCNLLK